MMNSQLSLIHEIFEIAGKAEYSIPLQGMLPQLTRNGLRKLQNQPVKPQLVWH